MAESTEASIADRVHKGASVHWSLTDPVVDSSSREYYQFQNADLGPIQRIKPGTWHVGNEVEWQPR